MSIHEVKVVKITEILPHPNADTLELIPVWGYTCAVRKDTHKVGDLAVYVEPDYEVPLDRSEFSFLSKPGKTRARHRIAVKRLRGMYSQGLLIPAPEGAQEGDNLMEALGITRYEPPEEMMVKGAFAEKGPEFTTPKYDLENHKKYKDLLVLGEAVILTAKIHGTNARYVWAEDRMWCGSRTQWKMKPGTMANFGKDQEPIEVKANAWWNALEQNPWIETWCKANPGVVLYGEVYGPQVQRGFHYGLPNNKLGFAVFDIFRDGRWVPNAEFSSDPIYTSINFVPTVYSGPYDPDVVDALAEVSETFNGAGHVREGLVIKVVNERWNYNIGRVALKHVSNRYLEVK
ncbi:MAG: RNA ligase (ATP) [Candidatus Paceibacterota bacterium]|jgi:RNA ligase (TIGR02306 family)